MVAIPTTPDTDDLVPEPDACPMCRERHTDRLVWIDDDRVRCANCNTVYEPGGSSHDA